MNRVAKRILGAALLASAALAAGCASSGYPSAEDRAENVSDTIKKNNLSGRGNEARDQRFQKEVTRNPAVGSGATAPK